jgi:Undecaprenyl-phosphate galactose phosphotransferase WbaP
MGAIASLDVTSFYLSLLLSYLMRKFLNNVFVSLVPLQFDLPYFIHFWWMPLIFLVLIAYERLYTKRMPFWDEAGKLLKAVTVAVIVILAITTLGRFTYKISRLTIVLLYFCSIAVFPVVRLAGKKMLYRMNIWKENLIIIGAGRAGQAVAKGIANEKHMGYNIIGFLDDAPQKSGTTIDIDNKKFKVFGKIKHFRKFLSQLNIQTVIIAIPSQTVDFISRLTEDVQKYAKHVLLIPDLNGIALVNTEVLNLSEQKIFMLNINNNLKSDFNRFVKRDFDFFFSLFFMPLLFILVAVVGMLIRIDTRGSIFLSQERIGKGGKIFSCLKFRTMFENADEILAGYLKENDQAKDEWRRYRKLRDHDPRVTRVGKFLRKTSLDELPQLFNVLFGDMSFFGPRPYMLDEASKMGEYAGLILLIAPGITGLWQVSGRNELDFEERIKLDTWYVLNWSLWLDIVIFFKTIRVVLNREGAY